MEGRVPSQFGLKASRMTILPLRGPKETTQASRSPVESRRISERFPGGMGERTTEELLQDCSLAAVQQTEMTDHSPSCGNTC